VILREPASALDPRMRAYWTTESLIATAVAAGLTAVPTVITALAGATTAAWIIGILGGLVVLGLGVSAFVTPRLDYRHYRYEVTELGLYVARGWLWRRWQIVPHARVQTVDTTAGPLLRAFGLVAVAVTTASAAGGTSIPGLRPDIADALVAELARRAGIEEGT
jgi:uncharacterized protein